MNGSNKRELNFELVSTLESLESAMSSLDSNLTNYLGVRVSKEQRTLNYKQWVETLKAYQERFKNHGRLNDTWTVFNLTCDDKNLIVTLHGRSSDTSTFPREDFEIRNLRNNKILFKIKSKNIAFKAEHLREVTIYLQLRYQPKNVHQTHIES